eukprot:m51a1_g546 putative protein phosphatase methylesterase (1000) ;mRNA; r:434232-438902
MQREIFKKPGAPAPAHQPHAAHEPPAQQQQQQQPADSAQLWRSYFDECRDLRVGDKKSFRVYFAGKGQTVFLMLHGAGYSALSFALVAARLKRTSTVIAFDQRAHGWTSTDDDADLSAKTLVNDVVDVANAVLVDYPDSPVVLVGHSMGGAIAVKTALAGRVPRLTCVVVLDVVEGTAIAALPSMVGMLEARPRSFPDIAHAITWSYGNGGTRNVESAEVSVPEQLRKVGDMWVWRTDLRPTEKYWRGWFENLSQEFLTAPVSKLLVIAGADRLDTALTIGQMQGKFMIKLMPSCGHFIHEDEPDQVAAALLEFAHKFARLVKRASHWRSVVRGLCDVRSYQDVCAQADAAATSSTTLGALAEGLRGCAGGRHVVVAVAAVAQWATEAECARAVVQRNGASDVVRVVEATSLASATASELGLSFGDCGAVVVADLLGEGAAGSLGSGLLAGLLSLHRSCPPGSTLLPRRTRVVAQGVEIGLAERVSGFDLGEFARYLWDVGPCEFPTRELAWRPLTREVDLGEATADLLDSARVAELELAATASGRLTAFVLWLEAEVAEGSAPLRTQSGSLCWVASGPLSVKYGDQLRVRTELTATSVSFSVVSPAAAGTEGLRPAVEMWHYTMLADGSRNDAYEQGIARAVSWHRGPQGSRPLVFEVGAGTGLLSMMAARRGAEVVAAEQTAHMAACAQKIVEANGLAGSVAVLAKHSSDVSVGEGKDLRAKPDVLVFEIFDYTLLGEGVLPTIRDLHERSVIDEHTVMVPYAATVFAMLVEAPRYTDALGFDLSDVTAFRRVQPEVGWDGVQLRSLAHKQLTAVFRSFRFDFRKKEDVSADLPTHQFMVEAQQDGEVNAIAYWFHLHVDPEIAVNTLFTSAWVQGIQYFSDPMRVARGDKVQVLGWVFRDAQLMFAVGKQDGANTGPAGGPVTSELPRWSTALKSATERLAEYAESHKAVPGSKASREDLEILARIAKDAPSLGVDRQTAQTVFRRTLAASWPLSS